MTPRKPRLLQVPVAIRAALASGGVTCDPARPTSCFAISASGRVAWCGSDSSTVRPWMTSPAEGAMILTGDSTVTTAANMGATTAFRTGKFVVRAAPATTVAGVGGDLMALTPPPTARLAFPQTRVRHLTGEALTDRHPNLRTILVATTCVAWVQQGCRNRAENPSGSHA